ncbi:acyl-CoA thioesterase [Winogradskyella sp. DF17]|uniref:Acyl-CoA thioesterase n=1 Tax=Winogradskyella pelagia TaxID=2819984 RepID=A0ABS3T3T8_9FLAO|nr:thioesterase family protein [Winogradskyella sp. DF17]MBO3117398.1 acyl-CoA thioesterase [Winogradskyella sp. DF17]
MEIFEKTIIVQQEDLDALNHVNNVRYVQWVQDIAEDHWLSRASEAIKANFFWVMLSHNLEYKSPAHLGDTIKLKTYVTSSEGVTSTRQVEFLNTKTNKQLVKSATKWCLLNKTSQRPTRITAEIKTLFN